MHHIIGKNFIDNSEFHGVAFKNRSSKGETNDSGSIFGKVLLYTVIFLNGVLCLDPPGNHMFTACAEESKPTGSIKMRQYWLV